MTHFFWLTLFALYLAYAIVDAFFPFWERNKLVTYTVHLVPKPVARAASTPVASATSRVIQNFQSCDVGCACNDCQISRGIIQQVQRQRRESFS